jgi:gluconate 2-dehydrogenase subunit 3-like protein
MDTDRRTILRILGTASAAVAFTWTEAEAEQAHTQAQTAQATAQKTGTAYKPKFFNAHEWATIGMLTNMIIPKDDRSGSATDAGVPEFMDFMMVDQPSRQTAMRGGLAWLDRECVNRYEKAFVACTEAERTKVLDDIAWPSKTPTGMSHGVAFFNSFRDLTASGFWTSRMGIKDLQYQGNVFVAEWKGCPDEVLKNLGVTRG